MKNLEYSEQNVPEWLSEVPELVVDELLMIKEAAMALDSQTV
jgi:hypothetical protein